MIKLIINNDEHLDTYDTITAAVSDAYVMLTDRPDRIIFILMQDGDMLPVKMR